MRTLCYLLDKEWRQFLRNPFLPKMAVVFPLMVMLVIPWVTTMDVRHVNVAVVDGDRSPASRRLIQKIDASDYFTLQRISEHYDAALEALEAGDADVIVEIPDNFERSLAAGKPEKVDIAANGVPVGGYDSVIPAMLSGLPDLLMAVVVVLVLSASMSTLSSLVLTSSSTLTLDLLKDHVWKDMDQKRQVFVMRCLIVVFIAISVVLAIIQYRSNVTFIAQLMGVSWGALAGAFLAPFLYGLYWKKATRAACWTSCTGRPRWRTWSTGRPSRSRRCARRRSWGRWRRSLWNERPQARPGAQAQQEGVDGGEFQGLVEFLPELIFQVALHQGQPHLIFFLGHRLHIRADIPGIEPFHKICHPKNHLE